jgi:hypothetical protein
MYQWKEFDCDYLQLGIGSHASLTPFQAKSSLPDPYITHSF